MTYFGFLAQYVGIPTLILLILTLWDRGKGRHLPPRLQGWSAAWGLGILVVIAVCYSTPWDNYLVATGVWWYDPALVTGLVIGWVPIEEYTFFVVQTLMTGLWLLYLARRSDGWSILRPDDSRASAGGTSLRRGATVVIGGFWLASIFLLLSGQVQGTYLGLELSWALIPIGLQLAFGADILWLYRRLLFWTIVPSTVYLCIGDSLAIGSGTWTIDPVQSTGILAGNLPLEEIVFFLVTNILVSFGLALILAQESQERIPKSLRNHLQRLTGHKNDDRLFRT